MYSKYIIIIVSKLKFSFLPIKFGEFLFHYIFIFKYLMVKINLNIFS